MAKKRQTSASSRDRFGWLAERLEQLDTNHLRRQLVPRNPVGTYFEIGGRRVINFGSNDYLGIAAQASADSGEASIFEPFTATEAGDLAAAEIREIPITGAGASPLVCGFTSLHQHLCRLLADFEGTESAVIFPSGFAACSSVLPVLADAGDLILSDALNHASLIDGCRLSKADRYIYPHRDVRAVEQLLKAHRRRFQRVFLVTDTVFSMDGTIAPLQELADLAERFKAILIVDEAHATGVLGDHGGGVCEMLGVEDIVPIRIGTMSKALGASGGFVAGPTVVIETLIQKARPLVYSTAAPPISILAAIRGLQIIRQQPERRVRLKTLIDLLRSELAALKLPVVGDRTPIIPLVLTTADEALQISQKLECAGYFVPAIRPPTVPEKTSRLRISLSALHSEENILQLARELARLTKGSRAHKATFPSGAPPRDGGTPHR